MNEEKQEMMFDLLTQKTAYGLNEAEQLQLDEIDPQIAEAEFHTLELTAAAISLVGQIDDEPLPPHLFSKIAADADRFVVPLQTRAATARPPALESHKSDESKGSWFGWLGWAAAAAACVALAINIWFSSVQPAEKIVKNAPPPEPPAVQTHAEMRAAMVSSNTKLVKANWAAGNVKELEDISGDVVWSDQKQAGYLRFRGLPVNDTNKETYQLWIFDKTQDSATPIDGGTFNVSTDGEVVIAIDAKLKAQTPEMFAVTIEKPGGVVVSKREKIVALAKVETKTS